MISYWNDRLLDYLTTLLQLQRLYTVEQDGKTIMRGE
jgi:hypothetical protein